MNIDEIAYHKGNEVRSFFEGASGLSVEIDRLIEARMQSISNSSPEQKDLREVLYMEIRAFKAIQESYTVAINDGVVAEANMRKELEKDDGE